MHYRRICVRGGYSYCLCSTFVVDVKRGHFLFLNVVFVFIWLTCLVSVSGVPPLSHSGASMIVWLKCLVDMSGVPLPSHSGASVYVW